MPTSAEGSPGATFDVRGSVPSSVPSQAPPVLHEFDVRLEADEAVRRGWAEIGRRLARLGLLVSVDVAATGVAGVLALAALGLPTPSLVAPASAGWDAVLFLAFVQPLALGAAGSYGTGARRIEFGRIVQAVIVASLLAWLHALFAGAPTVAFSGAATAVYAAWAIATLFSARLLVDEALVFAYSRGLAQRKVLMVGTAEDTAQTMGHISAWHGCDVRVVGRLSPGNSRDRGAVGTVSELEDVLRATGARGVILASTLSFEAFETFIRRCFDAGVAVSVVPRHLHHYGSRLEVRRMRGSALLELHPQGLRLPQLALKRMMDVALSLVILVVAWPLMALIALLIRIDSPGPVLFRQRRAGLGGRPFYMFKFRTMVADADRLKAELQHLNESGDPRLFKIRRDPRVTRMGRWLRRTSLDELPQLFNVLRGEMSLVGPRPFFPEDLATYEESHFERLSVLPGITGLWQVSGRSDIVDFEEVVRLDADYIRNWSIWRDLVILVKTLPAAFGRDGAY